MQRPSGDLCSAHFSVDGPVHPRQRLFTVADVGRGAEGGDVLALEQQKLSWAIREGAWGEIFPCLRLKDPWLRLSLAKSWNWAQNKPSSCFALESTLNYTTARTANKHIGNIGYACPHWIGWEMSAQVFQMQSLELELLPWISLSLKKQDYPEKAMHCLCLSAEYNGNPVSPTPGVSARWWELSWAFPFFLLCSFIPGSHTPAVVCVCSLLLDHKLPGQAKGRNLIPTPQHMQYPLVLKWLTHGFWECKEFPGDIDNEILLLFTLSQLVCEVSFSSLWKSCSIREKGF